MGCCISREEYRHSAPDVETEQLHRHQRSGSGAEGNNNTTVTTAVSTLNARLQHVPPEKRYNQPLVRRAPWTSKTLVTARELRAAREEFWETRVTGRREIWGALKAAVELMNVELATAQGIIDAAGINVPTGDLAKGAYDELGQRYEVPEYCFGDPINVANSDGTEEIEEGSDDTDDVAEGKGKMPARVGKQLTVRARLSDRGGPDIRIKFEETASVKKIAHMIAAKAQLPTTQRVSVMYLGKILEENKTLVSQGWKKGNVVNALVRAR
ncbi:putative ubiquitin domain protein [Trichophaea hybrida]|nr:putative ubiquitin domain protein [Trichophaea hybrida]